MFQEVFARDANINKPPKAICTTAYYFDPDYFATLRIARDPGKIVSFYFLSNIDARYTVPGLCPSPWVNASKSGNVYLYGSENETYLTVAPGKAMVERARADFLATTGLAATGYDLPDENLIEFLQTKPVEDKEMALALIVTVWEP
jgi:hypothetical protein